MNKLRFNRVAQVTVSALPLLLIALLVFPLGPRAVQAGAGTTIDLPASNVTPVLDGVCSPAEYSDATKVTITVGTSLTFPVYLKHTADTAYFCFGDAAGLPLPAAGVAGAVTVYVDTADDGVTQINNADDYGFWVPYTPGALPFAHAWGGTAYNGADPGGWQAAKFQTTGGTPVWTAEFSISRQTLGGWNHPIGLALFYHWWQFQTDDYSWPANGIWAAPQLWGNAALSTGSTLIGAATITPVLDGKCGTEYTDASAVSFTGPSGPVTAYLKHTLTDLYVCLTNLAVPGAAEQSLPNAAVYLNRAGTGGAAPGPDDLLFTISYSGTAQGSSGDGAGFTGPDPGGWAAAETHGSGTWEAEFRIGSATIGNWLARRLNLSVEEVNVGTPGDYAGWPVAVAPAVPNTWGDAQLTALGFQVYLPKIAK